MQRSYYLMREVARRHDVHVVAFRQRAHQPTLASRDAAVAALSEFATIDHVSDLPQDELFGGRYALAARALLPGKPYTIRWGWCSRYRDAVQSLGETFRPNVVHFDTVSLAPYLPYLVNIPAVLTHHNIESAMLYRRAENDSNLLRRAYYWQEARRLACYERHVARLFHTNIVCADTDEARLLANVGPVETAVIPNGVDLDYFRPEDYDRPQDAGSLVFVGGMSWYPNASAIRLFLSEVWPLLVARRPDLELRLIGRNPPRDICQASERDRRIKVMGFLDDIRPTVHRSAVYVCPIFDGGGTKLKMLDAMAMAKAIVAHPVAAEGLGIQHGEEAMLASQPDDFADIVLTLLADASRRKALGRAARALVERRFSFAAIGAQLAELLGTIARDAAAGHPVPWKR